MAGLAVAVILCIGKTVQTVTGIHMAATDYAPEQTVSADGPLEIVNTETFRDHTTLVVTATVRTRDPDSQDLLTAWQKKIYSRECVRLDGYDQEQVTYTVLPDSRSGDSVYGSVLIQFMDGDRCVFAMTDVYDSGDREMTSLEKTCMIPCDIPAWTSVTVTRLL